MPTIGDVRRANLELLIRAAGTMEKLAAAAETTPQYLSQVRNQTRDAKTGKRREIGTTMARRLEDAGKKTRGWLDQVHAETQAPQPLSGPAIELARYFDAHVPPGMRLSTQTTLKSQIDNVAAAIRAPTDAPAPEAIEPPPQAT